MRCGSAQTEVAVINAGAIRSDIIYPAGTTITRREVLAALPFDNRLVTIDVSGSALKAAIEKIGGALASQAYGYGYPVYGYSYGYPAYGYSAYGYAPAYYGYAPRRYYARRYYGY